jgi:nucleolar MIF4G domain-containing protein 1
MPCRQISSLYQNEGRSLVSATVASELVSASAEGPRATQRFAAVAAALISGLAGLNKSQEIVASFLAKVAEALQASLKAQEADSLAIGNLVQIIAQLFLMGSLKADVVFSLLDHLCENFLEANIAAIAQLLQAAGLVLRSSDPERMKGFIISVHARAAEVGVKNLSARARVMMDIVVDVKNNRKRELTKQMTQTLDAHMLRWLKNTGISSVALGGISWNKVLEKDKRGFWWLPSAKGAVSYRDGGNLPVGATGSIALLADQGSTPPETLLKLASQMNMNTDTRRAVFCAIMGSEDAIDATEKLLSLGLKGDQERQMVRVNIECCLAEKSYNPYYLQVLKRLCTLDKNHRVTLQYCMWDNWKTLERLEVGPLHNLARLGGAALCSSCLSPTALRVVEFLSSVVTPKQLLFWRILFESMLKEVGSQEEMVTLFSKVMTADNLADLRRGLLTFIKQSLGPWIARKELDSNPGSSSVKVETLLKRCRLMERVLAGRV